MLVNGETNVFNNWMNVLIIIMAYFLTTLCSVSAASSESVCGVCESSSILLLPEFAAETGLQLVDTLSKIGYSSNLITDQEGVGYTAQQDCAYMPAHNGSGISVWSEIGNLIFFFFCLILGVVMSSFLHRSTRKGAQNDTSSGSIEHSVRNKVKTTKDSNPGRTAQSARAKVEKTKDRNVRNKVERTNDNNVWNKVKMTEDTNSGRAEQSARKNMEKMKNKNVRNKVESTKDRNVRNKIERTKDRNVKNKVKTTKDAKSGRTEQSAKKKVQKMTDKDVRNDVKTTKDKNLRNKVKMTTGKSKLETKKDTKIIDNGDNKIVPEVTTETKILTSRWWHNLVAGGLAGAVSRTCTAPLDRLKTMFRVYGYEIEKKNQLTIAGGFQHMVKEEGVKSLWRGNGINGMKVTPETAIKFLTYEQFKNIYKPEDKEIGMMGTFAAGASAGVVAQTCVYPLEVMKTRMTISKTGQYKGFADCVLKLYNNEGPRVFAKGYIPNTVGIIPYAGIDMCMNETLKKLYMRKHKGQEPGMMATLAGGVTSSVCGLTVSYPMALVKTRMQSEVSSENTMSSMFKKIYSKEGVRGFYHGLGPTVLKVAPTMAISWAIYESVRKHLRDKKS